MRFCLKQLKCWFVYQFLTVHFCALNCSQNSSSRTSNVTFSCIRLISLEDHIYTGAFRKVRTIYRINLHSILNASQHSLPERTSYKFQPKWEEIQEHITPSMPLMVSTSMWESDLRYFWRDQWDRAWECQATPLWLSGAEKEVYQSRNKNDSSWGLKKSVTTEKTIKENY